MIRRAIIAVLMLGAVGTGILGVVAAVHPRKRWSRHTGQYIVMAHHQQPGMFGFVYGRVRPNEDSEREWSIDLEYLKIGVGRDRGGEFSTSVWFWWVEFPPAIAFVLFATYPTFAFLRGPMRRRRRRRKGLCLKCGYDLTGNESGVCPECGTQHNSVGSADSGST